MPGQRSVSHPSTGGPSATHEPLNSGEPKTMILDTLQNIDAYEGLHPLFPAAFRHLRELASRKELPQERLELDGERIYAVFVRGSGRAASDARLETHRRYIDIQYTVAGADRIGWLPAAACAAGDGYNEVKDVELFPGSPGTWVDVPAGHAAIFFPPDAHAPMANTGQPVTKIVIKVAANA